jgi:5-carboxymethyl-2-hydroxymuconate isomerase
MPHIHLETTADLHENADVPEILEALTRTLSGQETMTPLMIKSYHTLLKNWHVGEGHPAGFAHLRVEILAGRPDELKTKVADAMFAELKDRFAYSLEHEEARVTMELREMDPFTYRK